MPRGPRSPEAIKRQAERQRDKQAKDRKALKEAREAVNRTSEQAKLLADHAEKLANINAKHTQRMANDPAYAERRASYGSTYYLNRQRKDEQIEASGTPKEREELKARRAAEQSRMERVNALEKTRLEQAKALVAEPGGDSNPAKKYVEARKLLDRTKARRWKSYENRSLRKFAKKRYEAAARSAEQGDGDEGTPRTMKDSDTDPQDESESDYEDGDPRERDDLQHESSGSDWHPDQERSTQSELETGLEEPPARRTRQARRTNSQVQYSLGRVRLNLRQALIYCQSHTRRRSLF